MPTRIKTRKVKPAAALAGIIAVALACLAGVGLAGANQGGLSTPTPSAAGGGGNSGGANVATRFGHRVLRQGMTGPDVKILKGIVRSKSLLRNAGKAKVYDSPTTQAVRKFQRQARLKRNGVANRSTSQRLIRSLGVSVATWYGPGFYGNRTACGQTLRPKTVGVAHKTLPCGTKVLIGYKGRFAVVPVIDRGPYGAGRTWDLTKRVSDSIGMTAAGVGKVRSAVIKRG